MQGNNQTCDKEDKPNANNRQKALTDRKHRPCI